VPSNPTDKVQKSRQGAELALSASSSLLAAAGGEAGPAGSPAMPGLLPRLPSIVPQCSGLEDGGQS